MNLNEIYLGDAYELIKDIPDKSVDLVLTDVPYLITATRGGGVMASREKGTYMEEIAEGSLDAGIDMSILDEFVRVLKKINCYIFCSKAQILPFMKYFVEERKCNWEMLIWAKDAPIPFCGTHYLVDKEYCLYFWEQGAPVDIPFERAKTVYFTGKNVQDKKLYGHPTIKPLEMIRTLIENSAPAGGGNFRPIHGKRDDGGSGKGNGARLHRLRD